MCYRFARSRILQVIFIITSKIIISLVFCSSLNSNANNQKNITGKDKRPQQEKYERAKKVQRVKTRRSDIS